MDRLHKNIARYTHSGSKPCKLAAAGEIPIGISFAFRGARSKAKGAPIEIIVPAEGVGWEMEASGIIAGTDKLKAAKTLMDWSISRTAMEMYNTAYAVVGMPGVAKPVEHFPPTLLEKMITNDFEWAANNRKAILERMEKAMAATVAELWKGRVDGLPIRNMREAVILASIVEKETGVASERARVAAIFVNRLRKRMRLQSDPTMLVAAYAVVRPIT